METLRLVTNKEYELMVGGFYVDEEKEEVKIRIITEEAVETVIQTFSDAAATESLKVVSADGGVQRVVNGYTERGDVFTRAENVCIDSTLINGERQERYGTVIEFKMKKRALGKDVEKNRADIDYLMMMEGEMV